MLHIKLPNYDLQNFPEKPFFFLSNKELIKKIAQRFKRVKIIPFCIFLISFPKGWNYRRAINRLPESAFVSNCKSIKSFNFRHSLLFAKKRIRRWKVKQRSHRNVCIGLLLVLNAFPISLFSPVNGLVSKNNLQRFTRKIWNKLRLFLIPIKPQALFDIAQWLSLINVSRINSLDSWLINKANSSQQQAFNELLIIY